MNNARITLITLALALTAASAAWGADPVPALISSGAALQKDLADAKLRVDAAVQKDKDVAAQGKELIAEKAKLLADLADWQKEDGFIRQRSDDFNNRCNPDKRLNAEELKACKKDADEIGQGIAKVNGDNAELGKRNDALNAKIPAYNQEAQKATAEQDAAHAAFDSTTKKEGAWLDVVRKQLSSDAYKPYGAKAGCPDMDKRPDTTDAIIKMTDDVIACLKKASNP
jgi:hypothetical protein